MAEPLFLTSKLLPVPHGFSLREGGVSGGAFASLNLGFSVGDEHSCVEENVRRLCAAAAVAPSRMATASQVHGTVVLEVKALAPPSEALTPVQGEADALTTSVPEAAVGVKTADCVPILLVDPVRRKVAAVHSGWRGTFDGISSAAVSSLLRTGGRASDLLAAIGPSIRACCYEVSEELASRFTARFGGQVVRPGQGRPHLDLVASVLEGLTAAGVPKAHIDILPHCTSCDPSRFFSHRRDQGVSGRHLSFAVCRF